MKKMTLKISYLVEMESQKMICEDGRASTSKTRKKQRPKVKNYDANSTITSCRSFKVTFLNYRPLNSFLSIVKAIMVLHSRQIMSLNCLKGLINQCNGMMTNLTAKNQSDVITWYHFKNNRLTQQYHILSCPRVK